MIPTYATALFGAYTGTGTWVDIAGDSKHYRISQEIKAEGNSLQVAYRHDFFQEGTSIEGVFAFEFVSDEICSVKMKGAPMGHGYLFADYLHYYLQIGEMFVEVSYQVAGNNLRVRGSSTKNAQGRFIAWHEELTKQ